MEFDRLQDSGDRTEFDTGGRRDLRTGKGRYDLIPLFGIKRLAVHSELGAEKYGIRNFEKGMPTHCYIDSALRHIFVWLANHLAGREQQEDHLIAAAWNLLALVHTEEMIEQGYLPEETDDIGWSKGDVQG